MPTFTYDVPLNPGGTTIIAFPSLVSERVFEDIDKQPLSSSPQGFAPKPEFPLPTLSTVKSTVKSVEFDSYGSGLSDVLAIQPDDTIPVFDKEKGKASQLSVVVRSEKSGEIDEFYSACPSSVIRRARTPQRRVSTPYTVHKSKGKARESSQTSSVVARSEKSAGMDETYSARPNPPVVRPARTPQRRVSAPYIVVDEGNGKGRMVRDPSQESSVVVRSEKSVEMDDSACPNSSVIGPAATWQRRISAPYNPAYAHFNCHKVTRKLIWAEWFMHRSTEPLESPPPDRPGHIENNTLFVLANPDTEAAIRARGLPQAAGLPPRLSQCLTIWIWKESLQEWETIQYGDVRVINGERMALSFGGPTELEPRWILYQSLTKEGYKRRG